MEGRLQSLNTLSPPRPVETTRTGQLYIYYSRYHHDQIRTSAPSLREPAHISDWYQNRNTIRVCCSNVDATFTVLESLVQRRVSVDDFVTLHIVAG